MVDVLAVGAGAYLTGGLRGPLWLFLYPQVVAVSVRARPHVRLHVRPDGRRGW